MTPTTEAERTGGRSATRSAGHAVYGVISGVALLTSVGIWVLMVVDTDRGAGAATLEMLVKFTNLTVVLIAVVCAWIACGWSPGPVRQIAHLTVIVMAVVTAVVNATLLDAALPAGWWGVVDLFQHYLLPAAVVVAWAVWGPPVGVRPSQVMWVAVVPLSWLIVVLARGAVTGSYPYDFLDVSENGAVGVMAMVGVLFGVMLAVGLGLAAIDRRRRPRRALG